MLALCLSIIYCDQFSPSWNPSYLAHWQYVWPFSLLWPHGHKAQYRHWCFGWIGLPVSSDQLCLMLQKLIADRLFGYDQGVMGGLLDLPSFVTPLIEQMYEDSITDRKQDQSLPRDRYHNCHRDCSWAQCLPEKSSINHSRRVLSTIEFLGCRLTTIPGISVASYNVGCFFGAIACIFIGNPLGRRKTIFLGSAIMVVGAALQCSSSTLGQFISGRLITGYGLWFPIEHFREADGGC